MTIFQGLGAVMHVSPLFVIVFLMNKLLGLIWSHGFSDTMNFFVIGEMPKVWNKDDRVRFLSMVRFFT